MWGRAQKKAPQELKPHFDGWGVVLRGLDSWFFEWGGRTVDGRDIDGASLSASGLRFPSNYKTFAFFGDGVGTQDYNERAIEVIGREQQRLLTMPALEELYRRALDGEPLELEGWLPSKRTPYAHQVVIREWLTSLDECAVFAEQGTGKTQATAEAIWFRRREEQISHALVVCPVSLVLNWAREIELTTDLTVKPLAGKTTKQKTKDLKAGYDVYVVNYESLEKVEGFFNETFDWRRTMVVADESTKIKNPSARRSKMLHEIGARAGYKAILTGTPCTQGPQDAFSQYLFLDGGSSFGNSYSRFVDRYFYRINEHFFVPSGGSSELISDIMYQKAVRFTKEQCLDLPEKIYTTRYVDLGGEASRAYKELENDAMCIIGDSEVVSTSQAITVLLRLGQIASGHVPVNVFDAIFNGADVQKMHTFRVQPKIDTLREMLVTEFENKKVVVWTRWIEERNQVKEMLNKEGISFVSFDETDRQEAVDKFQTGDTRVFLGNPASGGLGITLTSASTCIYLSNSFSLEERLQSEDRVHRIGQTNRCQYIDIVAKGTVDEKVLSALRDKNTEALKITQDNWRAFL